MGRSHPYHGPGRAEPGRAGPGRVGQSLQSWWTRTEQRPPATLTQIAWRWRDLVQIIRVVLLDGSGVGYGYWITTEWLLWMTVNDSCMRPVQLLQRCAIASILPHLVRQKYCRNSSPSSETAVRSHQTIHMTDLTLSKLTLFRERCRLRAAATARAAALGRLVLHHVTPLHHAAIIQKLGRPAPAAPVSGEYLQLVSERSITA